MLFGPFPAWYVQSSYKEFRDPASRRRRRKGSLKSETVKYGRDSLWSRTRERLHWQGSAAYTKDIRPLAREGAPPKEDRNCQTIIYIWS
jgi:hypothetical protein